jgi:GH25 family lysozyme M1 (1,4-beta-N-acetylmuramidase)
MRRTLLALVAALMLLGAGVQGASAWTNGDAPSSAMSPIATGVKCTPLQGQLEDKAAAAWNSMALAAGERLPDSGCDSAYRPYSRQLYYWQLYQSGRGNLAAYPGTSNHGLGLAIDVPQFVRGYVDEHGQRFGWCKCWSDAQSEWWHLKYNAAVFHRPNPGTNLHSPRLQRGSGGPGQNVYVRKVQKLLRGHGDKSVDVDGEFGRSTAIAVRRFQKAQRIPVNGIVSPRVWKRLRRPISKPVKTTPAKVPGLTKGAPAKKPTKPHKHPARKPNKPAWGIDISSNNGCPATGHPAINFKAVRHDGASFAITKATEGTTYLNPCFGRRQLAAIGAAHLVPGVYHWLSPGGSSGKAEAAFFANAIGHAGYGKGFLMPFVDVEEKTSLSDSAWCHEVGEFVHTVKKVLGEKPVIYTYPSYVDEYLRGCSLLNHYLLWIAHPGADRPLIPSPWHVFTLWQYTWTAHVAGVAGEVDVSKVRGGRRALEQLRVRGLPKRVRKAPRAKKVTAPLAAESRSVLRTHVPAADAEPLTEVPVAQGGIRP